MDAKLRLHQHVSETRNRICSWLRVRRSITAIKGGADIRVLKTFYLQARRIIIDYAAPLLATIHPAQIEHLEKTTKRVAADNVGSATLDKGV